MSDLDKRIAELAAEYRPLAVKILKEAIRCPADHLDEDPRCGTSNHEGPRVNYLKSAIIECGAVEKPEDVWFDDFGALTWQVEDKSDPTPRAQKKVVWLEGHTDTVNALPSAWKELGDGVDCYDGLTDASKVDMAKLKQAAGHVPEREAWEDFIVFGRGGTDQLSGVVNQIVATKVMLETKSLGSLRGVIVRCIGTIAEEDNDGGVPMHLMRHELLEKNAVDQDNVNIVPDVVILTEGTGDTDGGPLGIYRGQRGRVQILVTVTGTSCHGSMPYMGKNPLEYGAKIIVEATEQYKKRESFLNNDFLGEGSRTASWAQLDTPSDCAVPERFAFRFDRRITFGEEPEQVRKDIEALPGVQAARDDGLTVEVTIPKYTEASWRGVNADNFQEYMAWETPEDHASIVAAVNAYKQVVTPRVQDKASYLGGNIPEQPRVSRWIFSTDGVGYPIKLTNKEVKTEGKDWLIAGNYKHPAMLGFGSGYEQNAHKIGENVDSREFPHVIAFYARYPSMYANPQ